MFAVEDAVAVEMNHVERLARLLGLAQSFLQRLERGRREQRKLDELAQIFDGFDERARADAMVNVGGAVVFGARADEQDANWLPGWPGRAGHKTTGLRRRCGAFRFRPLRCEGF